MKIGVMFLLSVLSALFVGLAHGENNAATTASAQAAAKTGAQADKQPDTPRRGTLYRVRNASSTIYLFGTVHVGLPSFFPLETEVTLALARADRLVLELDVRNSAAFQAALQQHGLYGDDDSIERHLTRNEMTRVKQTLERFHVPLEKAKHMKPWLLANLLVGLSLERNGYQRSQGIELFLLALAEKQKMVVQELESADYQMALFDSMTESEQAQYLLENLDELDDGNAFKKDVALIDAWAHPKGERFEDMLRDSLIGKPASAEFTRRILLGKRNPEMTSKIEALLHRDGTSFVAIGLLHLVGKGGVPNLLKEKGYAVEKLY